MRPRTALITSAALLALAGCGGSTHPAASAPPTTAAPAPTPSTSPPPPAHTGPIDTRFVAQNFTGGGATYAVTLTRVLSPAAPDNSSDAAPAGKYLVGAKFTLTGIKGTSSDDADADAQVIGSDGQVYTPASEGLAAGTDFNYGQWQVQAGETEKGWVAFELPDSVKPVAVKWELAAGFTDTFATWKLRA